MMKKFIILACFFALAVVGCATFNEKPLDSTNLATLQNLTSNQLKGRPTELVGRIRLKAIREIAMTLGAQGGLAFRARQLNDMLHKNAATLSRVFDFNGLLLNNNVLPPVLVESQQSLSLTSQNVIQRSDHTYQILKPARFVTAAPTWRDYLWMNYQIPPIPDRTLLPKNNVERKMWIKNINLGWQQGIEQANNIYRTNLAELRRDFAGMSLFRQLLARHIVSKPFVSTANRGIISNPSHTEVHVNDQILRIAKNSQLTPSRAWQPVLVQK